jgi:hypothetical protein
MIVYNGRRRRRIKKTKRLFWPQVGEMNENQIGTRAEMSAVDLELARTILSDASVSFCSIIDH